MSLFLKNFYIKTAMANGKLNLQQLGQLPLKSEPPALENLTQDQLQEALKCLYLQCRPQDLRLLRLQEKEWLALSLFLHLLMAEREQSPLH